MHYNSFGIKQQVKVKLVQHNRNGVCNKLSKQIYFQNVNRMVGSNSLIKWLDPGPARNFPVMVTGQPQ